MSLGEVLLRLGCTLVAWMVVYTHCIWLATLSSIGCQPGDDALARLLFGFAGFTIGFAFLLNAIERIPEVARMLRWLAVPLALLIPMAALPALAALRATTMGAEALCGSAPALWHGWWAPVQLATLGVVVFKAFRLWRTKNGQ